MKKLTSKEELDFLKEIHDGDVSQVFCYLRESFALLQTRSQMLLGLATICLTITGFSGPRMAASNSYSRIFIATGLLFVSLSVLCILVGPLRLRWMTAWKAESMDQTMIDLLVRRDHKTRLYRVATALLLIGLGCYLFSVVGYLISVH